jgi:hypothetical protein
MKSPRVLGHVCRSPMQESSESRWDIRNIDSLLHIAVVPGVITGFLLSYVGNEYHLTTTSLLVAVIPLWLATLTAWIFGMGGIAWIFEFA